jgi:hypothetical protein
MKITKEAKPIKWELIFLVKGAGLRPDQAAGTESDLDGEASRKR